MGSQRQRLDDLIKGALLDSITQHGAITAMNVGSASKRVTGQITGSRWAELADSAVVERLRKRLAELKHGHARTVDENRRLRERISALEHSLVIELSAVTPTCRQENTR